MTFASEKFPILGSGFSRTVLLTDGIKPCHVPRLFCPLFQPYGKNTLQLGV